MDKGIIRREPDEGFQPIGRVPTQLVSVLAEQAAMFVPRVCVCVCVCVCARACVLNVCVPCPLFPAFWFEQRWYIALIAYPDLEVIKVPYETAHAKAHARLGGNRTTRCACALSAVQTVMRVRKIPAVDKAQ